jgi:DNA repair protein RadC
MGESQIAIAEGAPSAFSPDIEVLETMPVPYSFNTEEPQGACESGACLPWVRATRDPTRFRKCLESARKYGQITDSKKIYGLLKDYLTAEDQEVFYVVLLDTQLYVRGVGEITRGARDRVQVPIPDVLRLPLLDGATAFIVAHNHPSGVVKPSEADKELTKSIIKASQTIGIPMFDHIIVGSHGYFSFADEKLIR